MNRIAILALMLFAPTVTLASYSMSGSQWLDQDGITVDQQVLVDGEGMNCPPALNCAIYTHSPSVYNVVGPNGGWQSQGGSCAYCYISYSTVVGYAPPAGQLATANGGAKVQCTRAGTIFQEWLPTIKVGVSRANYKYDHNDGKNCYYKLDCFTGSPTCAAAAWDVDVNGMYYDCEVNGPYFLNTQLVIFVNGSKECLGLGLSKYRLWPTPCS